MVKEKLEKAVASLVSQTLGLKEIEISLEHPNLISFGDYTTNVALKASKILNQSSLDIANRLVDNLSKVFKSQELLVEKVEVAGPGFINFYLDRRWLVREVWQIIKEKDGYGRQDLYKGKRIMIEFADPNPFKEFHIGHLRNIALGESLVRLQRALAADVWPVNYQGDVGLHVAKSLWGLRKLGYDRQKLQSSSLSTTEKVKVLGQAYVAGAQAYDASDQAKKEILVINLTVYNQDESQKEILELWKAGRAWSLDQFGEIYRRVGTSYQRYYFESEVVGPGRDLVLSHLKDGIFEESEGAVIFDGARFGLHKRVFISQEGYGTYEAKDMYLAPLKYSEFPYDLSIIMTGEEQAEYFKVVLKALSLVSSELAQKTVNLTFGMVNLKGEKMASRKGNVITADWLFEQAKSQARGFFKSDKTLAESEEIAEKVAVGAVKYSLLRSEKEKPILFDLEQSLALEGNSGPYLQYAYARACSVLRKSKRSTNDANLKDLELGAWNLTAEETVILKTLYKFPEVVETAAVKYEPHQICNFLFDLAQKFNLFYNNVPILGKKLVGLSSKSKANTNFRLALTAATAQVIKNGLYLLGIESPETM